MKIQAIVVDCHSSGDSLRLLLYFCEPDNNKLAGECSEFCVRVSVDFSVCAGGTSVRGLPHSVAQNNSRQKSTDLKIAGYVTIFFETELPAVAQSRSDPAKTLTEERRRSERK